MTEEFWRPGDSEVAKAMFHVALLALGAVCASYNAVAWARRRERHLGLNIMLYSGLVWYEGKQIVRHLRRAGSETRV